MTGATAPPQLRRAIAEDVPRLKELGVAGWETTYPFVRSENRAAYLAGPFWSLERLRAVVADPRCLALVAVDAAGGVQGFVTVEPHGEDAAELTRLYVDPVARGRGIGAALVAAALDWARKHGATRMLVNVFAENTAGRRFYERHGFRLTTLGPTTVGDQVVGDAWYEVGLPVALTRG